MGEVTGVNDEFGLLFKLIDSVDGCLERSVDIGIGRLIEADVAVADLNEGEVAARSFFVLSQTKYGRSWDSCSHRPNQAGRTTSLQGFNASLQRGIFADEALRKRAPVTMCKAKLPDVLRLLCEHLRYVTTFSVQWAGEHCDIRRHLALKQRWTPVLVFSKGEYKPPGHAVCYDAYYDRQTEPEKG